MEPLPPDPIDDGDPLDDAFDDINPAPDMPDQTDDSATDDLLDVGRDVALEQLETTRKTLASDAFQERVVEEVNERVNIPMVPEAVEATAFDTVYELVQGVAVGAVDRLIDGLKA